MRTNAGKRSRLARLGGHLRSHGVAYLALVVALMTPLPTYANHLVVKTSDIVNGAVNTPKLKNRAVTTAKLRNQAVTNAKIADEAITFDKIGFGQVTRPRIGNNAVNSAKIAAGGVRARNLGEVGVFAQSSSSTANGASASATITCPAGTRLIGGGFQSTDWRVETSARLNTDPEGWFVQGRNESGGNSTIMSLAYCLDV